MVTVASERAQLARLIDGYLATHLIHVAVELGLPDLLAAGARTAAGLARATGTDAGALYRVLRGLASEGLLEEQADGGFSLTALGDLLRTEHPGSMRGVALMRGRLYTRAMAGFLEAVRQGGTAFEAVYGQSFFAHLDAHPEEAAGFQASMAARSRAEADAVVAAYDFRPFRRVVDVGGGRGILLSAILRAAPEAEGVLLDREEAVAGARTHLESAGVDGRWQVVAGDFFAAVPEGGDLYLLSRVIHDWDDAAAGRILSSCRRAMAGGSRLLLVEAVLPDRAVDDVAGIRMDLHMLALLGGRERTVEEYRALLTASGLTLTRVIPTAPGSGISLLEAVPAAI